MRQLVSATRPGRKPRRTGYTDYHPVVDNGAEAGRAENCRVDLVVMPRTRVNLAMPDGDAAKGAWRKITE